MSKKLYGPDGQEIPETLIVEYDGRKYPWRIVNGRVLSEADPRMGTLATLVQMGDQTNLIFLGMMCLAKDIYSQNTESPTNEFLKFAKQLRLNIIDIDRNELDVATELEKRA